MNDFDALRTPGSGELKNVGPLEGDDERIGAIPVCRDFLHFRRTAD